MHHNPIPIQTQSTSLIKALLLLLAQMVEDKNIDKRSMNDIDCMSAGMPDA